MNILLQTNKLKFFKCSNSACNKLFLISPKEVEHGSGIHFCPTCFSNPKTHHTIQCSNCLSIIDFLKVEENEKVTTYYARKCMCCNGTVEDEIHLSKNDYAEVFAKS
ncbi:MAG: hypothetical protein L3J41_02360 [Melioribacteraceae bacterium]|nr:hypothetical protein [Melioribacteraceae bacterium]